MSKLEELLLDAIEHSHDTQESDPWYAWNSQEAEEYLKSINSKPYLSYLNKIEEEEKALEEKQAQKDYAKNLKDLELSESLHDDLSPREIAELYNGALK